MRLTDRLGKAQKIAIVIAFGMAVGVAGSYLLNLGSTVRPGWYAYAPADSGRLPAAHQADRMVALDHLAGRDWAASITNCSCHMTPGMAAGSGSSQRAGRVVQR